MLRAGLTDVLVIGNPNQVNQRQHQPNGQPGKANRSSDVSRSQNGEDQKHGEHRLSDEAGRHGVMVRRMQAVAIGAEAAHGGAVAAGEAVGNASE